MSPINLPRNTSPTFEMIKVDPATAELWLKANTRNRALREQAISEYARDMQAGRWLFNGDSIRISKTGVILDGQHRLHAMIEAGKTYELLVISGLEDDAQATMDTGRGRRAADVLQLQGEVNAPHLAAIARKAWMWEQGNHRFRQDMSPSRMELTAFLSEHPELRRCAELSDIWYRSYRGLPKGVYGIGYYILSKLDQGEALWFFQHVTTGIDLPEASPILTLRARILSDRLGNKKVRDHLWLAYCIRAWNANRKDRPLTKIQQSPQDDMPMPI